MGVTVKGLQALEPGKFVSISGVRGAGTLEARRGDSAVLFYFRYTGPDGGRVRIPLGTFDSAGKAGLSLAQATAEAGRLSKRYQSGERDLRGAIAQEARERERLRLAEAASIELERQRELATLGALAGGYTAQLRQRGKSSAKAVQRALERHMRDKWPELWVRPAAALVAEDFIAPLAELTSAGKTREAAKLRAYLRAAYAAAVGARTDPRSHVDLRKLGIKANPLRDMAAIPSASPPRMRALSVDELRAYWHRISALANPWGALLRFHLLSGGQRCEQLSRATTNDLDRDAQTLTLFDSKGRRTIPRTHVVPLVPKALEDLDEMRTPTMGEFVVTVNCGSTGATYYNVQAAVRNVSDAMVEAGEATAPFTPGDLRRTIETRLAALGVSAETRAHVQSHGLGGVQARHYDRHDYLAEKKSALELLFSLVTSQSAAVTRVNFRRPR